MRVNSELVLELMLIVWIGILTGCSNVSLNAGASDYAVAKPDKSGLMHKFEQTGNTDGKLIEKGESISVNLQHAFVKDFSERTERITTKFGGAPVRGEIAIIANVFELEDKKYIDFRPTAVKKEGRLIYYSEDVRSGGHPLNFSSLPIYGPIEYKGNPLVLHFTILELDVAESSQITGLLKTLAGFGKKTYPPSSPVLDILDGLGSQLLSGEQDDLEFQYVFLLHPKEGHEDLRYPILMVGDYVLLKEEPMVTLTEPPFKDTDWQNLRLNTDTGRLEIRVTPNAPSTAAKWEAFKENTYMVIQINEGLASIGLDVAQKFTEFEAEINQAENYEELQKKLDASVQSFKSSLDVKKNKQVTKKLFDRTMTLIQDYKTTDNDQSNIKKHIIAELYDMLVKKQGFPKGTTEFTAKQQSRIVRQLRQIANDPYNVTWTNIEQLADARGLETLLTN